MNANLAAESDFEAMFQKKPATIGERITSSLMVAGQIYLTIGGLCLPYFLWKSAREHSFWTWLLDMVAIQWLKVFVWPYFLFF